MHSLCSALGARSGTRDDWTTTVGAMLMEPLLRDPARPAARWKFLLLTSLVACSIVLACMPEPPPGRAALLSSTTADVEPDSYIIPPPCLTVIAGTALSGTALLVSLTVAVPAIGFFEDGVAAESIAASW